MENRAIAWECVSVSPAISSAKDEELGTCFEVPATVSFTNQDEERVCTNEMEEDELSD
jgi:hypothetical protein